MKPSIQQQAMRRAWEIFRQTNKYPAIEFADIGRPCFAWALRQARIEVRETARLRAMTPAAKPERIGTLQALIAAANFIDSRSHWAATVQTHRNEIRRLQS